jgi:hypothetical protein
MKKLITLLLVAGLILTLTACAQPVDTQTPSDITAVTTDMPPGTQTNDVEATSERNRSYTIAPETFWLDSIADRNFKTAIVGNLDSSRLANDNADSLNNISEVHNFYLPQKIAEFELYCVSIGEAGFVYYFSPPNDRTKKAGQYFFSHDTDIEIIIERPEARHIDYINMNGIEYLREIAVANNLTLTEDGFLYCDNFFSHNLIDGQIGNTIFSIRAPKSFDYERLRSLARELISTAELVNVDEEIGRLAAE